MEASSLVSSENQFSQLANSNELHIDELTRSTLDAEDTLQVAQSSLQLNSSESSDSDDHLFEKTSRKGRKSTAVVSDSDEDENVKNANAIVPPRKVHSDSDDPAGSSSSSSEDENEPFMKSRIVNQSDLHDEDMEFNVPLARPTNRNSEQAIIPKVIFMFLCVKLNLILSLSIFSNNHNPILYSVSMYCATHLITFVLFTSHFSTAKALLTVSRLTMKRLNSLNILLNGGLRKRKKMTEYWKLLNKF